jgi:hypothetical protein
MTTKEQQLNTFALNQNQIQNNAALEQAILQEFDTHAEEQKSEASNPVEQSCANGVCVLNWKPVRKAPATTADSAANTAHHNA